MTITLNRPDVLNALNRAVHRGIHGRARATREDPSVRAVVITGAGRGFCVGQDLQEFSSGAGDVAENLRENYHRNVLAIRALEKPVIAAVNGPAAGAGMSLALACDVRIAADSASFVPAFIKIGLVPDSGGTWLVRRLLGAARAFEWLTTGRRLGAEEARDVGPRLRGRAGRRARAPHARGGRALRRDADARRLADEAPARRGARRRRSPSSSSSRRSTQAEMTQTHDFTEGVAAFLAKRPAEFTGADLERLHPITVRDVDDRRRWRLTTFLRLVLALPHLYLVEYWGFVAVVVGIVNWFIALVRGRTPLAIHEWLARYARYSTHVDGVRLLARRPVPEVPRLARHVSRRPARRPARHAVALEDRVPARRSRFRRSSSRTCSRSS